jgi:hypothetical protein
MSCLGVGREKREREVISMYMMYKERLDMGGEIPYYTGERRRGGCLLYE